MIGYNGMWGEGQGKGKGKGRGRGKPKGPAAGIQAHWEFAVPDTQLFDLFLFYYWGYPGANYSLITMV